jgi:hypothetical protein
VSFESRPPAAARRALRIPSFRTDQLGWDEAAICLLLDFEDVIVDGVYVDASTMSPRRSVWAQLRERLRPHGIRLPLVPPSDAARFERPTGFQNLGFQKTQVLGATGCTGSAG